MKRNNLIFMQFIMTFTCVLLPAQARPQNDDTDIFAVDGFAFDGPAEGLDPITFERTTKTPGITSTTSSNTAPMTTDRCINVCPITSEYNPVCGTDGVVYSNPGHLRCAQRCGRVTNLVNYGPCVSGNARG